MHAWLTLGLIGAAFFDLPFCRSLLRYFLVITTIFLTLRFDVNSGVGIKIEQEKFASEIRSLTVMFLSLGVDLSSAST